MHLQSNISKPAVALALMLSCVTACGSDDDDSTANPSGGSGTGGSARAGSGTGGSARAGSGTGGSARAGSGTGGSARAGSGTGGSKGGKNGQGGSGATGGVGATGGDAAGGVGGDAAGGVGGDAGGGVGGDAGNAGAVGLGVELGAAEGFAILAKSAISTVPTSAVTGNIGVSPAAATYITGFSLTSDATNVFSTSPQVTGKVYAADYTSPTPSDMTTAVSDMELAFTDAAGRAPDVTELGAGDIGGMTLDPGVYQWGTGLLIPTDITLKGNATAVWIFQIAEDLTLSNGTSVVLDGGALAKHVFWQVSGQVVLGTTAHVEGVVLSQTAVTLGTGASINGRLLAQTAVSLDASAVVEPAP